MRLLFFIVPFAALFILSTSLSIPLMFSAVIAAVFAALIAMSLSLLFLSKQREAAAQSVYEWRHRDRTADEVVEDEVLESSITPSSQQPAHGKGSDQ